MAFLEVENLHHQFGSKPVLQGVTLKAQHGSIVGIFGRNGCGKSTLLKILYKQYKLQTGAVRVNQIDLNKTKVRDQLIGYLPQHRMLPREQKVRDVIAMCCKTGQAQDAIFYSKGVHEMSHRYVNQLSEGQLKYLSALIVLNLPHPLLLLDEPFSMVDPLIKEYLSELLQQKKNEKLILLTDHYYRDVFKVSDQNWVIENGICQQASKLEDLKTYGYLL